MNIETILAPDYRAKFGGTNTDCCGALARAKSWHDRNGGGPLPAGGNYIDALEGELQDEFPDGAVYWAINQLRRIHGIAD